MKNLDLKKINRIISGFKKARILVIGDLILDEFIWGKVSRISPEAPVPVVCVDRESVMPGGGSNVANNIRSLGALVHISGVIGRDEGGRRLAKELTKRGIKTQGMVIDSQRPTSLKTRVIAHHQQVVRIDKEKTKEVSGGILDKIISYAEKIINEIDAIIIEDYGKGVIVPRLLKEIVSLSKNKRKIITIDPKEDHFPFYRGVTSITPNHHEAEKAVGMKIKNEADLKRAGKELLRSLECETVLITRGENGMSLFEKKGAATHIPTVAQDVFDVSGAGDTVISVYTLALSSGATPLEAAHIANCAAGIVVGKVGIEVVTPEELRERIKKEVKA